MKPFHLLISCFVAFSLSWGLLTLLNPNKFTVIIVLATIPMLSLAFRAIKASVGLILG